MADQAWIAPAEAFIRNVLVPNSVTVTILVVLFQGALAVAILSRRSLVGPALIVGGVFSLMGAFTGNPTETIGTVPSPPCTSGWRRPTDVMKDQIAPAGWWQISDLNGPIVSYAGA